MLNPGMQPAQLRVDERTRAALDDFGQAIRDARNRLSISQMTLERLSGVDQTMISRLERGRSPHASLENVLRIATALGVDFPLGYCPHDHRCRWRPTLTPSFDPFMRRADQAARDMRRQA
jgi:transcriptional regulator with XRE-family HTH domain